MGHQTWRAAKTLGQRAGGSAEKAMGRQAKRAAKTLGHKAGRSAEDGVGEQTREREKATRQGRRPKTVGRKARRRASAKALGGQTQTPAG